MRHAERYQVVKDQRALVIKSLSPWHLVRACWERRGEPADEKQERSRKEEVGSTRLKGTEMSKRNLFLFEKRVFGTPA